jgi:hypothetical protein
MAKKLTAEFLGTFALVFAGRNGCAIARFGDYPNCRSDVCDSGRVHGSAGNILPLSQLSLRENALAKTSWPSCMAMSLEVSRKNIGLCRAKSTAPFVKPPRDTIIPKSTPE